MRILKPGSGIALAVTAVCALAVSGQGQAPTPRYLYVNGQAGSRDTQVVNVIDTTAGEVVTGLATGVGLAESLGGLAVDDAGSTLYVSNATRRVINVVNIKANAVQATIPAEWHAGRLALSPDGKTLFALGQGGLAVIDTASRKVTRTITGIGNAPDALVVNAAGTRAHVTANAYGAGSGHLATIDLATGSVLGTAPVGNQPRGLALNPNESLAVVAAYPSGTVTFIDTAANAVAGVTTVPGGPQAVSFSPDGARVLVASMNSHELTVLDAATRQTVGVVGNNIGSGTLSQPSALAFSGDGQFVLVANRGRTTVSVHDATTLQRAKPSIWVGGSPAMLAKSAAFAGRPSGPAPSGPTLDDAGQLNPWLFNQCRDSWDCGSAPACDPFTECSVDRYECRVDPRHGGGTRCQWATTCGGCRPLKGNP